MEQYGEGSTQQKSNNGGWDSGQGHSNRGEAKEMWLSQLNETKVLDFYSLGQVVGFHLNFSISILSHNIYFKFYFFCLFVLVYLEGDEKYEETCAW